MCTFEHQPYGFKAFCYSFSSVHFSAQSTKLHTENAQAEKANGKYPMICRKSEVYHGKYPRSREKRKIFLYRFTACLGKDEKGRQIRRYRTWQVPQGLSPVRAERAAQRAADEWEKSLKIDPSEAEIPPAVHSCDFADFVNEVWLPLRIQNGTNKPVTVTFHRNNAKRLTEYFKGRSMQKITAIDIQRYLTYLRTEYGSTRGSLSRQRRSAISTRRWG